MQSLFGKDTKRIEDDAFYLCENLKLMIYRGTVDEWNQLLSGGTWRPDGITVSCADGEWKP